MEMKEHCERHVRLHTALNELLADYGMCKGLPVQCRTVQELLRWSFRQCRNPDGQEHRKGTE